MVTVIKSILCQNSPYKINEKGINMAEQGKLNVEYIINVVTEPVNRYYTTKIYQRRLQNYEVTDVVMEQLNSVI